MTDYEKLAAELERQLLALRKMGGAVSAVTVAQAAAAIRELVYLNTKWQAAFAKASARADEYLERGTVLEAERDSWKAQARALATKAAAAQQHEDEVIERYLAFIEKGQALEAERDRLRAALDAVQQVATKLKDPHYVTMAGSLDMHEGVRAVLELVADELAVALAAGEGDA